MKYHFLEEIDQQCRDLCVWKHLRPFCMSAEKKQNQELHLEYCPGGVVYFKR